MGNPRKPMAIRERQGTAKDHPSRQSANPPEITKGIGPSPKHFNKQQNECWDYLVSVMFVGVLAESDRPTFEVMAVLFARFRYPDYSDESVNPPLAVGELARLDSLFSRYGMTPSDRTKIVVPKQEAVNPFDVVKGLGKSARRDT